MEEGGPTPLPSSFQNPGEGYLHSGDPSFTTDFEDGIRSRQAVPMGFPTFNWTSNDPAFLIGTNTAENPMPPSLPSVAATTQWPADSPKKRKRGRPRKYQDPETGSATEQPNAPTARKLSLKQRLSRCGSMVSASAGTRLLPHVLHATQGQDVAELILAFKETTTLAFCVTSASGVLSSATLCNSGSTDDTQTYKGHLTISSLSGSYIPFENNGLKFKVGGLKISFIKSDGELVGGLVAGPLLAETSIEIQIFSFKFLGKLRDSSEANPLFCKADDS